MERNGNPAKTRLIKKRRGERYKPCAQSIRCLLLEKNESFHHFFFFLSLTTHPNLEWQMLESRTSDFFSIYNITLRDDSPSRKEQGPLRSWALSLLTDSPLTTKKSSDGDERDWKITFGHPRIEKNTERKISSTVLLNKNGDTNPSARFIRCWVWKRRKLFSRLFFSRPPKMTRAGNPTSSTHTSLQHHTTQLTGPLEVWTAAFLYPRAPCSRNVCAQG